MRNQRRLAVQVSLAKRSRRGKGRGRLGGVTLATMLGFSGLVPVLGQSPQVTSATTEALPQINADGWTSAAVCGECHQSIYAVWRESLHARAWSNPIFQAAYKRSIDDYGDEQARVCLSCYAPTVRHGNDFDAENTVTAEGVTCDFCHSVSAVDLSDPADPVRSDTRLKPDEVRTIDISFRGLEAARLVLSAQLYYLYSTEALVEKEGKQRIEPVEMKFLVASHQSTMKQLGR